MAERSRNKKSKGKDEPERKRRSRSAEHERPKKRRKPSLDSEDSTSGGDITSAVDSTSEGADEEPTLSLGELTKDLTSNSAKRREAAAHGLGRLGAKAKRAVPALAKLLEDDEERVRLRAARAIGKIGPAAVAAVPALAHCLKQTGSKDKSRDETSVAGVAVRALKRIGAPAWPGLLAVFDDRDLRRRAGRVLRSIEPRPDEETHAAVEALLEVGREDEAEAALAILSRHGAAAVPFLLRFAGADDAPDLQDQAEDALEAIGKDAVPGLASALAEGDMDLRLSAARNLARIAREVSQRAVARVCSRLEDALDDEDVGVRLHAVEALAALTEYASRSEPSLVIAMGDKDSRVGLAAVMALLDLAEDRVALAERMTKVLQGRRETEFTRVGACMILMHLGPDSKEAVPALLKAVEDPSTEVREYAHLALQAIRTPSMRVSVIRTASLRLKVVDEDEEDDEEDEDEESGERGPVAPRKRRRAGGLRARRVRRRR